MDEPADSFVVENEETYSVSAEAAPELERFLRTLSSAGPYRGKRGRVATSAALHIYLSGSDRHYRYRIVINPAKQSRRLVASFEPKILEDSDTGLVKRELRKPRLMELDECAEFIDAQARPIIVVFLKSKLTARYGRSLKIRLDKMTPVAPNDPRVAAAPFWDLEVELSDTADDANAEARAFFAHHGLEFDFAPLERSKYVRACLFPAATADIWASNLEHLCRLAFRHEGGELPA